MFLSKCGKGRESIGLLLSNNECMQKVWGSEQERCSCWIVLCFVYNGFCCYKMPSLVTKKDQPSTFEHLNQLSSPCGWDKLLEDNHKLRLQVTKYKAMLEEKSTQLLQKSKALINYQSTNLMYLQELVGAMKFKIKQQDYLEDSKNTNR